VQPRARCRFDTHLHVPSTRLGRACLVTGTEGQDRAVVGLLLREELIPLSNVLFLLVLQFGVVGANGRVIGFDHLFFTELIFFQSLQELRPCSFLLHLEGFRRFGFALKASPAQERKEELQKAWLLRNRRRDKPLARLGAEGLKANLVSVGFRLTEPERRRTPPV